MNFITKGDHLRIWNTASLWATKMSFFWVTATIFFNGKPLPLSRPASHWPYVSSRLCLLYMFFCFSSCKLWWFSDIQKGSSIVRHFKKEIQEIWKPSNKHPVKLLQLEPFGVLWSPMTPTERTVGSRTAKAFRKCHVVARDAFIKKAL